MEDGYAICFNKWALDKDIKNELGLLCIISSLSAEKGYCYANNKYLAELFNTNESTISRKIKYLEEKGYIEIEYEMRGCEIKNRYIRLSKMSIDDYQKCQSTIIKNDKDNNTIYNNTNINNNIYSSVIDYLNFKAGTNYRSTTNKTKTFIKARINEGFELDDFKKVIDIKCNEWLGTDMEKYLRPETLFGTKFESYLNQKEKEKSYLEILRERGEIQ